MSELSPEAKRLLEVARESYSPSPARVDAVREALAARITTPGSDGAASSAGTTVPAGAVVPKLVVIGLIAAAGAGALWFATRGAAPAPVARGVAASPSVQAAPPPAIEAVAAVPPVSERTPPRMDHAQADTETRTPAAHTPRAHALPSRSAQGASSGGIAPALRGGTMSMRASEDATATAAATAPRRKPAAPAAASSETLVAVPETASAQPEAGEQVAEDEPAAVPVDDSLAGELALLRRARSALDRHDAQAALSLTKQHAARYPRGTLRQERLATQILALCGLQRPEEARVLVRELERVAPRSPHLMRIRTSCVTEEGSDEVR